MYLLSIIFDYGTVRQCNLDRITMISMHYSEIFSSSTRKEEGKLKELFTNAIENNNINIFPTY